MIVLIIISPIIGMLNLLNTFYITTIGEGVKCLR